MPETIYNEEVSIIQKIYFQSVLARLKKGCSFAIPNDERVSQTTRRQRADL